MRMFVFYLQFMVVVLAGMSVSRLLFGKASLEFWMIWASVVSLAWLIESKKDDE